MRKILVIILCLYPFTLPAQSGYLSLADCVGRALDINYGIKISVNNESIERNNQNYSQFLPSLSAGGTQKESTTDTKRTDANGNEKNFNNSLTKNLGANVNLDWRLFDGLSMFVSYNKQREFMMMGELRTQLAVENLVAQVNSGYYTVLIQKSMLDAAKRSYELSAQRYEIAQQKYRIGNLSGLELKQTKIDLNADSSRLVQQEEGLRSAYINLNTLMNDDLHQHGYVNDTILLMPMLDYEEIQHLMLDYNTSLMLARKDTRVSELDLKLARSALYPTLDFSAGYNFSRAESPASLSTFTQSNGLFWGFSVNVPLFDKLENRRKIKNAKINIENKELSYQELELQMKSDLAQLFNSYQNSLLMVNFEKESAQVAYETLQAAMDRYRLGNLSGIEFREFQRSYIEAETRKLDAVFQAKVTEISLLLLSGRLKM